MNSFGRIFRIHIFGESHGESVGLNIDGCPAGLHLSAEDFIPDIERRKGGAKGTTPRKEDDIPIFKSGIFNNTTTGAPITIYLKITIPAVRIMLSKEPFPDRGMQTLLHRKSMAVTKITGAADTLAAG